MSRVLFALAFFFLSLALAANAMTNPVQIAGTQLTVISQLDPHTQQPQIIYWNTTNDTSRYVVTFVNLFESHNESKLDSVNHSVYVPTNWQINQNGLNVNFTTTTATMKYKNITFANYVSDPNAPLPEKDSEDQKSYKAGKFDIHISDYNFTDNHGSAPLILTFQLNTTDNNGNTQNKPLTNDQSLNIQFGMGYFAVNNTATNKNPEDVEVSIFRASTQFNMTKNNTNITFPVDNMQDTYIVYSHFPNGTITHDPEYGFGQGVPTAGKGTTIIIVVVVASVVVVVGAVIAGCYIIKRKNSRKNYSRF